MADIRELAQELVSMTEEEVKRMYEQTHAWHDLDSDLSHTLNPFGRVGSHKNHAKSEAQRKKEIKKRRKKNKSKRKL